MATGGSDFTSDEIVHIKCSVCAEKNMTREAERYCLECKDYYCSSCVDIHQLTPALRRHKILDKTDFSSLGPDGSLPSYPTQRCSQHQTEVINFYCKDHDVVTCSHCVALDHRSCKYVVSISENANTLNNVTEIDEMKQRFHTTKKALKKIKKHKEECLEMLKESLKQAEKSITDFRKEIEALLDKLQQETIKKMKIYYDENVASICKEMIDVDKLIEQLRQATDQLQKARGNKAQEFVCIKSHLNLTNQEQICDSFLRKDIEKISFIADQSIRKFLDEKRTFAQLFSQEASPLRLSSPTTSLYRVKTKREVDVKMQDESRCNVFGSCITYDGFVLLADNINCKIKRLDQSTEKIRDHIKLTPGLPKSISQVNKAEIVVTVSNNSVQFVSIEGRMSVTRTVNCYHDCFGVAHYDGYLVITSAGNTLYIHNMNGRKLKSITKDSSGQEIFRNTRNVAVSTSRDRIYVADNKMGLIVLDALGCYISTVRCPDGEGFQGVYTDARNIFVCNFTNGNIYQIGLDLQMLGILTTVSYRPLSLCYDQTRKRLIVTHLNSRHITVLELE